jgi:membrane-bound metal-dependent hydrolase YbcI (DUF457 family)
VQKRPPTPDNAVDIFTHALTSIAATRIVTPRAPRIAWVAVAVAGTIADLDELSLRSGASSYFHWHRTYLHSIAASMLITVICAVLYLLVRPKPSKLHAPSSTTIVALLLSASLIHLALDICQSDGITLWWPFSRNKIAADWLAAIDPWIIAILVAAILLPELLGLVSTEIGSKDQSPRGRIGACIGFAIILVYIGVRSTFHSNVISAAEARSYGGESPRRVGAFPESTSPFTWRAIIETDRALREITVNGVPGASFDPEATVVLYKPDPSSALEQARHSDAAKQFLEVARFPKASVEKTPDGYQVQFRDLRYAASGDTQHEIAVRVETDPDGVVKNDELVWTRELRHR